MRDIIESLGGMEIDYKGMPVITKLKDQNLQKVNSPSCGVFRGRGFIFLSRFGILKTYITHKNDSYLFIFNS